MSINSDTHRKNFLLPVFRKKNVLWRFGLLLEAILFAFTHVSELEGFCVQDAVCDCVSTKH